MGTPSEHGTARVVRKATLASASSVLVSVALTLAATTLAATTSCSSSRGGQTPQSRCARTVWYQPSTPHARVELVSSWTHWLRPGLLLPDERADGFRTATITPPAGEQQYALIERAENDPLAADETWNADPYVGTTAIHDGHEVTWIDADDCSQPALVLDEVTTSATSATMNARFLTAATGESIDPASLVIVDASGLGVRPISTTIVEKIGSIRVVVPLAAGKNKLTLRARDVAGRPAPELVATAWVEQDGKAAWDWRDAVIYQVIVDRYRQGAHAPKPLTSPSARAGGDFEGLRLAITSGELASLGVNTLWISPVYQNPEGDFPGLDGHSYSSYHGYWPISSERSEPRLGGDAELDGVVTAAHARGMRVLFDIVPNHVHEQHPYFTAHAKDGWFHHASSTDAPCVCGTPACPWDTHIEDCWFASYLPDLAWENPVVATQISRDVLWFFDRWNADGVRIDAVPMMPRLATRRIADVVRKRFDQGGNRSFLLGENFVGAGEWDRLRYQLGPFGLDSEFDFPLMWSLRFAIAQEATPMRTIDVAVHSGELAWGDAGAVMATMIGNHDVERFASLANGDGGADGFSPAPDPVDARVFAKQRMALELLFTLPGAPVVYYGDELALAGRADPDTRRVMPEAATWSTDQKATRDATAKVSKLRSCAIALRRGRYRTLAVDDEHLVFVRELAGADPVLVVATRRSDADFLAPLDSLAAGKWVDALGGGTLVVDPRETRLPGGSFTVRAFLPEKSACLAAAGP